MKFKHDLEMWHMFKEFAERLKEVAEFSEIRLINLCKNYKWDGEASEEYCHHPDIRREGDFDSKNECWKCPYFGSLSRKGDIVDRL